MRAREDGCTEDIDEAVHFCLHTLVVVANGVVKPSGCLEWDSMIPTQEQGMGDLIHGRESMRNDAAAAEFESAAAAVLFVLLGKCGYGCGHVFAPGIIEWNLVEGGQFVLICNLLAGLIQQVE